VAEVDSESEQAEGPNPWNLCQPNSLLELLQGLGT